MRKPTKMFFLLLLSICYSQDIIDPFSQPNDSTLAWYGSGDVDGDNDVDWDDYSLMTSIQNDMSDLNGDGIPSTAEDQHILSDYLNGIIAHLPSQWNKLPTRQERIDWLDKMLAIDQTDTMTYNSPSWICNDYAFETKVVFAGFNKADVGDNDLPPKYGIGGNGRFNIPVYYSTLSIPGVTFHGRNSINVDNIAGDPYAYIHPDQQENGPLNDLFVLGENWNPPIGSTVKIFNITQIGDFDGNYYPLYGDKLIEFVMDSTENLQVQYLNPNLLISRPTVATEEESSMPESFCLTSIYPNPTNSQVNIKFTLPHDDNVSIEVFDINGRLVQSINLGIKEQGNHKVSWNAHSVSSGIYHVVLRNEQRVFDTRKVVVLK